MDKNENKNELTPSITSEEFMDYVKWKHLGDVLNDLYNKAYVFQHNVPVNDTDIDESYREGLKRVQKLAREIYYELNYMYDRYNVEKSPYISTYYKAYNDLKDYNKNKD